MSKPCAIVTGASRGIGAAISRQLASQGIDLALCSRDLKGLNQVRDEIIALPDAPRVEVFSLDVCDHLAAKHLIRQIHGFFGHIDILINNAGVALDKWQPGAEVDIELCRQTFDVNLWACLNLCQAVLPIMREQGHGRIVNISSELGALGEMDMGMTLAYRSSKTALNAMTRILALELGDYPDIKINAAAPGWVKTELGGVDAPLTPEQGADTPVWLATIDKDGPTGGFFKQRSPYPW